MFLLGFVFVLGCLFCFVSFFVWYVLFFALSTTQFIILIIRILKTPWNFILTNCSVGTHLNHIFVINALYTSSTYVVYTHFFFFFLRRALNEFQVFMMFRFVLLYILFTIFFAIKIQNVHKYLPYVQNMDRFIYLKLNNDLLLQ